MNNMAFHNPEEDAQLITLARTDPEAFGQLYDRYAPAIYRYLLSRLGNVPAAQDVTSLTFLAAYEAFPRYRHKGTFSAWVFSIARCKYIDTLRKNKSSPDRLDDAAQDEDSDPLQQVIETERVKELRTYIHALHEDEQELLRLRYIARLSFADIAALLKKKEDAVKKNCYRLLARLQSQMEEMR